MYKRKWKVNEGRLDGIALKRAIFAPKKAETTKIRLARLFVEHSLSDFSSWRRERKLLGKSHSTIEYVLGK